MGRRLDSHRFDWTIVIDPIYFTERGSKAATVPS